MPAPETAEAARAATGVHPAWWVAAGLACRELGSIAVAKIRAGAKSRRDEKKSQLPGNELLLETLLAQVSSVATDTKALTAGLQRVELTMATKEDVKELHRRIDDHVQFHLEQGAR